MAFMKLNILIPFFEHLWFKLTHFTLVTCSVKTHPFSCNCQFISCFSSEHSTQTSATIFISIILFSVYFSNYQSTLLVTWWLHFCLICLIVTHLISKYSISKQLLGCNFFSCFVNFKSRKLGFFHWILNRWV